MYPRPMTAGRYEDVPWDPKALWDNGTSRSPSGHSTAKLENYAKVDSGWMVALNY